MVKEIKEEKEDRERKEKKREKDHDETFEKIMKEAKKLQIKMYNFQYREYSKLNLYQKARYKILYQSIKEFIEEIIFK